MSQSIVTIRLNGTPYQIGCGLAGGDWCCCLGGGFGR